MRGKEKSSVEMSTLDRGLTSVFGAKGMVEEGTGVSRKKANSGGGGVEKDDFNELTRYRRGKVRRPPSRGLSGEKDLTGKKRSGSRRGEKGSRRGLDEGKSHLLGARANCRKWGNGVTGGSKDGQSLRKGSLNQKNVGQGAGRTGREKSKRAAGGTPAGEVR